MIEILLQTNLANSKEAREFITSGAVSINQQKQTDLNFSFTDYKNQTLMISRGKKRVVLAKIIGYLGGQALPVNEFLIPLHKNVVHSLEYLGVENK